MLRQRIATAVVLIPLLLVVLFMLPRPAGAACLTLLYLGGAIEWAGFYGARAPARRALLAAAVAAVTAVLFLLSRNTGFFRAAMGVAAVLWVSALVWIVRYPIRIPSWSVVLAGLLILSAAPVALARLHLDWTTGPELLLYLFVLVWAADIGAYFMGRAIGKVKLAPRVSPGKTWEGVLGGLVLATLVAAAGSHWFGYDPRRFVPLSVAAVIVSVIGDLTVSIFKRNAGLKDSGWIFPGHGGVLDRLDSITAAGPVFVFGLLLQGVAA